MPLYPAQSVWDLRLSISQFRNEGCKVAGVVFNKAAEEFDLQAAQHKLGNTRIWGIVHDNPHAARPAHT